MDGRLKEGTRILQVYTHTYNAYIISVCIYSMLRTCTKQLWTASVFLLCVLLCEQLRMHLCCFCTKSVDPPSIPPSPSLPQVNSISMLGKTLAEALQVFQGVLDRINLLVCSGYDPTEGGGGAVVESVDETGCLVGSESLYDWRTAGSGGGSDGLLV